MKIGFIGHREVNDKKAIKENLNEIIEKLIKETEDLDFFFGSVSDFNQLAYEVVTDLKERYYYICPLITRTYIRAEFEYPPKWYIDEILKEYEQTFYPPELHNSGRAAYVKRNKIIVDESDVLIVYYDKNYSPKGRNSGTAIAVNYAEKNQKRIINIFELLNRRE